MNTIIEFYIVELVSVPNFSLNWQFCFFGSSLLKKGISRLKQDKSTSALNFAYTKYSRYQISAEIDNFKILDQICLKVH